MFELGQFLGYILCLVIVPYVWFQTTAFIVSFALPSSPEKKFKRVKSSSPRRARQPKQPKQPEQTTCTIEEGLQTLGISLGVLKSYIARGDIRTYRNGDSLVLNTDDVRKVGKKPGKRVYPVLDNFKDEHRITNPVEFDA
tara:strand:- start:157 stop:576 length:420 start_codon:yes stop_codon:yes gene_type:complete